MKTGNLILLFFLLPIVSCSDTTKDDEDNVAYQEYIARVQRCSDMPRPADAYNYPVLPGMKGWAEFKTTQEMVDACQIPVEVLKKLSTQAIYQAILEYPFFMFIIHRFQYQRDFEASIAKKDAYKELVLRDDAGECLYMRLASFDPLCGFGDYPCGTEVVLSQSVFLQQLDIDKKKSIVELSLRNDSLRSFSLGREVVWFLIGRTLYSANYQPFVEAMNSYPLQKGYLDGIINEMYGDDRETLRQLATYHGENFIKQ